MGSRLTPEQGKILSDINQYLEDARSISLQQTRQDRDRRNFYALSMVLFALANRLIDLGRETVYFRGYAGPEEEIRNKAIFKRLSDYNVIDPATRQDLILLVNFRNQCSHHFHEVTKEDLKEVMDSLPRYESYSLLMREELSRTNLITRKQMVLAAGIVLLVCILVVIFLLG
nr:HepT-like ribonuclease domain-containing protein [uncultured Methanospirillum sp.]